MFKRNQLEEAIALVYEPGLTKSTSEIRTQLKRLLETDRSLGRNKGSSDPERANFAFYSVDTPGRGTENCFSQYEAFALLTCLPHATRLAASARGRIAASGKARVGEASRPDFEAGPGESLDQFLIRQRAKPGTLAVDNTDPVFLVIASRDQQGRSSTNSAAICRGQEELVPFIRTQGSAKPWTALELVNSIYDFSSALANIRPRRRGRVAKKGTERTFFVTQGWVIISWGRVWYAEIQMSKKSTSEAVRRSSLFGPPLVLEGEDFAAYDELVGRIYAAVKPVDVLDEMFIADVASLEWDVLRWRRLKFHLIRSRAHKALTEFLGKYLDYDLYREEFTEVLSETLETAAPKDQAKGVARIMAHDCARDQADAFDKVSGILARLGKTMDYLLNKAQKQKAKNSLMRTCGVNGVRSP